MARLSIYHVWRRGDGYVGCSKGDAQPVRDNIFGAFTPLLSTADWGEAYDRIEEERLDPRHLAVVEKWRKEREVAEQQDRAR